jgi:hypothetical protein
MILKMMLLKSKLREGKLEVKDQSLFFIMQSHMVKLINPGVLDTAYVLGTKYTMKIVAFAGIIQVFCKNYY